jgi:predicted TIM-barrel fold metal-dependent hydrolase
MTMPNGCLQHLIKVSTGDRVLSSLRRPSAESRLRVRVDAHVHFYEYDPLEHPWVTDELSALRSNYRPADLMPLMSAAGFDGCVAVEARQSVRENAYLLDLFDKHEQIKAVVGWVDLCDPAVGDELDRWADHAGFAGVRHVLIDEPDDTYLLRPDFQCGIRMLAPKGLLYELLVAAASSRIRCAARRRPPRSALCRRPCGTAGRARERRAAVGRPTAGAGVI